MRATQEDWRKLNDKKDKPSPERDLKFNVRAAVSAENLTGTEEWDLFLSYLQKILESSKEQENQFEGRLMSPELFDPEKMSYYKSQVLKFKERTEVLEFVMGFPKQIMDAGEVSKKYLKKYL